jgi:hypothetical protein
MLVIIICCHSKDGDLHHEFTVDSCLAREVYRLSACCRCLNKETPMVKRITVVLAALSLFVVTKALTSCAHVYSTEQVLPFTTVAKGLFSGITDSQQLVVRTQEASQELWQRHAAAIEPRPSLPAVNFSREMLIASSGERPTVPSPSTFNRSSNGIMSCSSALRR